MIHHHTQKEIRNYDIFKGSVTALLLLLLFLLAGSQPPTGDVAMPVPDTEVAGAALSAPQLLSPAPGSDVNPGMVTFSGMGVPLSTAALVVDGLPAAQTAVQADGSWQMAADLAPGQRSIALQALDAGGNVAAAAPAFLLNVVELDAAVPTESAPDRGELAPPALPLELQLPEAGLLAGMVPLNGIGQPGNEVAITIDGLEAGQTTVGDDGTWSIELPLAVGAYAITVRQLTPDGAETGPAQELELNVGEMVLPTVDLPAGDLRSGAVVLSGTGQPLSRILLFAGSDVLGEATVADDGTWELPVDLPEGDFEIDIAAIGPDGTQGERLPAISLPILPAEDVAEAADGEGESAENVVTGTMTLPADSELPPGAVITIQLQDVSRAGAAATVIGEQVVPADEAELPFDYAVPYDPASIVEGNTYAVRGTITDADGNLIFTSDTVIPVITGGNPTEGVEVATVKAGGSRDNVVTGTVTYLQRSALAPTDVITVQLQDTSLADAPAIIIGEEIITVGAQQVPIDYNVYYDIADIVENHTYTMSARIEDEDGTLLFINDTSIPVITNGNPTSGVEIMTVPVAGATGTVGDTATVSGTVTYPLRIALPPDAVVEVSLQDISTPGAVATELGKQTIPTAGAQVPIPFEITYDPAEIVDNHTYAVRARITDANGDLIWTSDTVTPVITSGNPTEDVEIVVVQVPAAELPDVEFDPSAETAVDATDGAGTFNRLIGGLDAAGLTDLLADPDASYTLFAPTDAAFDALPPEVLAAWDANPARYAEMMSYLVVQEAYAPEDLSDGQVLQSIAGTNIGITIEDDVISVNGVPTAGSLVAGNSVVYALNQVILAPLRPGITPPLIDEKGVPVFKGPLLTVVGLAEPGKRILLQVDGENFGEIATVDAEQFWLVKQDIDSGVHTILAYMLESDDTLMAISQLVTLPVP